ncbi:MAG: GNAT family N-acyltransferase [Bryobacteraceae bacterium]
MGSGLEAYLARAADIPAVLGEIGRLREVSFRAVGEGTGNSRDLDIFDEHYLHLFLWNPATREIAGAYRLTSTRDAVARYGVAGLYTATLFEFDENFLARLGPALELGRSFVRAEYQRSFAPLLLLWKAIGVHVARHPEEKTLFGPVSISARYRLESRSLMVRWLEEWASWPDLGRLVRERNPFRRGSGAEAAAGDVEQLSRVVSGMEPDGAGVPVLLRQYLKLGGRLLGFNVDPAFSGVVDGLIVVDLTRTEPRWLSRYLGIEEAARFLQHHRGAHGKIEVITHA